MKAKVDELERELAAAQGAMFPHPSFFTLF